MFDYQPAFSCHKMWHYCLLKTKINKYKRYLCYIYENFDNTWMNYASNGYEGPVKYWSKIFRSTMNLQIQGCNRKSKRMGEITELYRPGMFSMGMDVTKCRSNRRVKTKVLTYPGSEKQETTKEKQSNCGMMINFKKKWHSVNCFS